MLLILLFLPGVLYATSDEILVREILRADRAFSIISNFLHKNPPYMSKFISKIRDFKIEDGLFLSPHIYAKEKIDRISSKTSSLLKMKIAFHEKVRGNYIRYNIPFFLLTKKPNSLDLQRIEDFIENQPKKEQISYLLPIDYPKDLFSFFNLWPAFTIIFRSKDVFLLLFCQWKKNQKISFSTSSLLQKYLIEDKDFLESLPSKDRLILATFNFLKSSYIKENSKEENLKFFNMQGKRINLQKVFTLLEHMQLFRVIEVIYRNLF